MNVLIMITETLLTVEGNFLMFKIPPTRAAEAWQIQGSERITRNISNLGNMSAP